MQSISDSIFHTSSYSIVKITICTVILYKDDLDVYVLFVLLLVSCTQSPYKASAVYGLVLVLLNIIQRAVHASLCVSIQGVVLDVSIRCIDASV